mmetsp:Transcript_51064/g.51464  ORF Transcript_51064/g.51464 Transcript_51064/m.51464 type:complete len:90 (-) Transcript_51064:225-494(-)
MSKRRVCVVLYKKVCLFGVSNVRGYITFESDIVLWIRRCQSRLKHTHSGLAEKQHQILFKCITKTKQHSRKRANSDRTSVSSDYNPLPP